MIDISVLLMLPSSSLTAPLFVEAHPFAAEDGHSGQSGRRGCCCCYSQVARDIKVLKGRSFNQEVRPEEKPAIEFHGTNKWKFWW